MGVAVYLASYAYWLATGIAFVISVFCAVAEGALLSYSPSRLEEQLQDPGRRARLEGYLGQVDRYLFSSIVLNAMSDVALVFACTLGFYRAGGEGALTSFWALVTSMVVVIVGAEVVPRAFSAYFADPLLPRVLPPLAVADRIFAPVIFPLRKLHDGIAHALGGDGRDRRAEEIRDDILSAAQEGAREGVLDPEASEMIENVIEFPDVEVRAIMTPRQEMGAIEVGTPLQEAVKVALEKGHSRMPIYEGTRDKVVGVLLAKDLLVAWGKLNGAPPPKDPSLRPLLRKPYYVPETKLIGELLREFRAKKVHIAIVLDEYGGTAGLVTIEDIIEEIVGEIEDEYDTTEPAPPPLQRVDDRTAEVDARMHVDELNDALSIAIPIDGGQYETLGGYLFYAMGKVPKKGERYAQDDAEFTILDVDERRIKRVRVQLTKQEPTS
ncbi:MAG TPA: hemolysin family protein [Planctomycetota bacterium]|nr:hemolysin family protein [Planctomycetota bacterium]